MPVRIDKSRPFRDGFQIYIDFQKYKGQVAFRVFYRESSAVKNAAVKKGADKAAP